MSAPELPPAGSAESPSPKKEEEEGETWRALIFVLINCALGAGVLHFPAAYDKAGGIPVSTLIQGVVMVLLGTTAVIMAYCSDAHGDATYHDVVESCCGSKARNAAATSVCLSCYGVCVTILIIIGDLYDRILASLYGHHFCYEWFMSRQFTIAITAVVFVMPLCHLEKIEFLQKASTLGVFAVLYPAFLTVYSYFTTPGVNNVHMKTHPSSVVDFIVVFPVFCFAYQMHELVVPAYASLKNRCLKDFSKSTTACLLFLFVVYMMVGCFGYATYGSAVKSDIMEMFNAADPFVLVGIAALIVKMVVTYPLMAFCGRESLEGLYMRIRNISPEEAVRGERKRAHVTTMVWFVTSTLLSVLPLDLGIAIKFLGCLSMFNIIIFPGFCLVGLVHKKPGHVPREKLVYHLGCALAISGIVLFGLVLVDTILFDLPNKEAQHICV